MLESSPNSNNGRNAANNRLFGTLNFDDAIPLSFQGAEYVEDSLIGQARQIENTTVDCHEIKKMFKTALSSIES